ncbi:MAG: rolling circle replication-associated protein [Clostridium sp.]
MLYRQKIWKQRKTKNVRVKESMEFIDIRISPITKEQKNMKRKDKKKESAPKQKKLNTKRSKEWHLRIIHCNFDNSDFVIHATFGNKERPITKEEVEKEFKNYILRINRYRKKLKLENAKYIAVIEGGDGTKKNVHFHIIIDGDLSREILEELWKEKGYINVDRLQMSEEGLIRLVNYMAKGLEDEEEIEKTKQFKGVRTWRSSKGNLDRPDISVNDNAFSGRKVMNMVAKHPSKEDFEKMYPGYILTDYTIVYNEEYCQAFIDIKMRRYIKNKT